MSIRVGHSGTNGHRRGRLPLTWILLETKTSFTSDAIRLDFPVPSSPHTQMRTDGQRLEIAHAWGRMGDGPVAMAAKVAEAAEELRGRAHAIPGSGLAAAMYVIADDEQI